MSSRLLVAPVQEEESPSPDGSSKRRQYKWQVELPNAGSEESLRDATARALKRKMPLLSSGKLRTPLCAAVNALKLCDIHNATESRMHHPS